MIVMRGPAVFSSYAWKTSAIRSSLILRRDIPVVYLTSSSQTQNLVRRRVRQEEGRQNNRVLTVPNALTASRIGLTPVLGSLIVSGQVVPASGLLVLLGATDVLDGAVARLYPSQTSAFGSYLDPLADKFLVAVLGASLTYAGLFPASLFAFIVARDVALVGAVCRLRYRFLSPPKTWRRYFDVTLPVVELHPTLISKFNTGLQLVTFGASLIAPALGATSNNPWLLSLWLATAASTFVSGLSYFVQKDTYRIVSSQGFRDFIRLRNSPIPPRPPRI